MELRRGAQAGESLNSDINVTPLVDVMLVMLIIFMLVTPMLQQGVGVDLPKARHVAAVTEDKNQLLLVVLKPGGAMFLGSDPIDAASLPSLLRSRHEANPGLQLQVKADRNIPYADVKKIIQAGRQAGFRGAAMIAEEIRDQPATAARPK